jgi:hypothetical protein
MGEDSDPLTELATPGLALAVTYRVATPLG